MGYIGYKSDGEYADDQALLTTVGERFVKIWDFMLTVFKLEKTELIVYAIIFAMYRNYRDVFKGSREYLASWSNSSTRTVATALRSLEEKKLIKKAYRQYGQIKMAVYHVNTEMLPTCVMLSDEDLNRDKKEKNNLIDVSHKE